MDSVVWQKDVGNIRFVDNNQCCWIVPAILVLDFESCVTSPKFSTEADSKIVWRIAKVKNSLYLWNENRYPIDREYYVTLSMESKYEGNSFYSEGPIDRDYSYGAQFLRSSHNFISKIPPDVCNGCIKIFCKLEEETSDDDYDDFLIPLSELFSKTSHEGGSSSEGEEETKTEVRGVERLVQNLKKALDDGQYSDVTLKAEDREFRVHRVILRARSPVFASMFEHEMTGKTTAVVDIPDCTAESFEVFLQYIYTGTAKTMSSDNVFNLYYAADKYRVDDLKEECVQFMKDNMSVENVCDVVALSLRHSEKGLLKEATDFFRRHIKKIIKTVKWQTYMQENSTHANELLVKALDA